MPERLLELREVYMHFADPGGAPVRAVDGVSLALEPGELVAVYGPSGSGKTTLLLLMAGLMRPDRGSVAFDGRDLATLSRREAARHRLHEVGFVAQSSWAVPGLSAADNVALKLIGELRWGEARARVAPLLERVGLAAKAEQQATRLSMGERQRVAIARALSNDPRLVLADEPTGNLDTGRGGEILSLLSELCRERRVAVVLATHDPQALAVADRVRVLRDGRLVDELPPGWPASAVLAADPHGR